MAKEKVCLAYSGGLDTSCILAWLLEKEYEVICFMANVGQVEDFEAARQKSLKIGAKECIVKDLRQAFVEDTCIPAIQCNAVYEDIYLLGTSLARPIIARAQIDSAKETGCHFELAFYSLQPTIKVIAPWRLPEFYERFQGRNDLLDFAAKQGIPVTSTKAKPWSMDENLVHCSYEAGILEDPDVTPPKDMWQLTVDPMDAPDKPEDFQLTFEKGVPVKLEYQEDGESKTVTDSLKLFLAANTIGGRNGVGRVDIVENRFIGLKSRGCYESPGMELIRSAHLDLEGLVLDREVRSLRDQFVSFNFSKLLYNGLWFSPEREFLSASLAASQKDVNGVVRCRAYKGKMMILGRSSSTANLYDASQSSMDEIGDFNPSDTSGFIGVQAIRLKKYGKAKEEKGEKM